MNSFIIEDITINDNVNIYKIRDLNKDSVYVVKNFGDVLDKNSLYMYVSYCYENYFLNVKGYSEYLFFEKEDCNDFSLEKYKLLNSVALVGSKLNN